ncbi:MAG: imidazole glycerol phosphate synthase subunit HisH [Bdellovibrionota bacterium]
MTAVSRIVLLDTGIGNIQSVANVLEYIGAHFWVSDKIEDLSKADKIIFPGVGTYGNAIKRMKEKGLFEPLKHAMNVDQKPSLGICVGMQVLSEIGYEFGEHQGLGIIPGSVKRLQTADRKLRLPHVGWNDVSLNKDSALFKDIEQGASFYFLHSYYFEPSDRSNISCTVDYGQRFTAAIERGNVFGVQFHPEKSQGPGIQLFKNFVEM